MADPRLLVLFLVSALAAGDARALTLWDEAQDGDLSGDRLAPTALALVLGTSSLHAMTGPGSSDREYVTLALPAGASLAGLRLVSFQGDDVTAFIGMQSGTQMTVDPAEADPAALLGYAHFGPGNGNVGADLLPGMGLADGAIGFVPPLTGSYYTLWIQQAGSPSTYQLDFHVVPEPAALGALGLVGLGVGALRRRSA